MYEYGILNKTPIQRMYPAKLGLLGGTFNPPHNGHLVMANGVLDEFVLEKILFMPSGTPPHKKDLGVAHALHRRAMLELLIKDRAEFEVCDIELKRKGVTYTVDTLEEISKEYTGELYYIIGTDTLFDLENWRRFEDVAKLTRFICVKRPGDDKAMVVEHATMLMRTYGAVIFPACTQGPDISSTDVRGRFLRGRDITNLVPGEIKEYMESNNVFTDFH